MRRRIALLLAAAALAVGMIWGGGSLTANAKVGPTSTPSPGGRVLHKNK